MAVPTNPLDPETPTVLLPADRGDAAETSGAPDDPACAQPPKAAGCVAFFRKTDAGAEVLDTIRRAVTS